MSSKWWTRSWNPVTGCSHVSKACDHCYAEAMTRRFWKQWGCAPPPEHFAVTMHPDRLDKPAHWHKPQRVFVCSMSDLFHEKVPDEFVLGIFDIMAARLEQQFLILTKRPANAKRICHYYCLADWGNVWLGVTAENQARFDECWPVLRDAWPGHKFISVEPMLGPVDIGEGKGIEWVICGGETGPGARRIETSWAWQLYHQCRRIGIPFFFKEWGDKPYARHRDSPPRQYPAALLLPGETP